MPIGLSRCAGLRMCMLQLCWPKSALGQLYERRGALRRRARQRLGESSFRDRRAGADHRPLITAAAPGSATGHPRVLKSSSPGDCARPGPGSKAAPRPAERADDDDEGYRVHPADRGLSQRSLERGRPSGGRWLAALVHWGSTARGVQKPTPPRGLLLNGCGKRDLGLN